MAFNLRENGSRALKISPKIITLDVLFRAFLGVGFGIMIIRGLDMPQSSFGDPKAYPIFVGTIGLVLWAASNVNEALQLINKRKQGRIYDISFETEGISTVTVWLRTAWVFSIMVATILGVWLVNFHLAIPIFLISYLRFVGKMRWRSVLLVAIAMEIPIVILYGAVIHTAWPDSLVERVFDFSLQDFFDGPLG
jgi:hypothetical protein